MAFTPRHNAPLEMKDWADWVQKRDAEREARDVEQDRLIALLMSTMNSGAKQTTHINQQLRNLGDATSGTRGLPDGDAERLILRTTDDARPYWSGELIDQQVYYAIGLGTGWSYAEAYAGNSNTSIRLPAPTIGVDEKTLDPIRNDYADEFPMHLELLVNPTSDLEEFEVWFPSGSNDFGNTSPNWSLLLHNFSDTYRARIHVMSNDLMYAGTNVPVLGDPNTWDLDPKFEVVWRVDNAHNGWRANAVTPLSVSSDALIDGGPAIFDKWYVENVSGRANVHAFTHTGTVTTSTLKQTYYNDTVSKQYITAARATVGTAPTGADLLVDVKVDGVSAFTTTITATETTGTAVPDAQPWPLKRDTLYPDVDFFAVDWPVGSYLTVEVTQVGSTVAGSDLTVQVWAG